MWCLRLKCCIFQMGEDTVNINEKEKFALTASAVTFCHYLLRTDKKHKWCLRRPHVSGPGKSPCRSAGTVF